MKIIISFNVRKGNQNNSEIKINIFNVLYPNCCNSYRNCCNPINQDVSKYD
jgi:hypothetical protein